MSARARKPVALLLALAAASPAPVLARTAMASDRDHEGTTALHRLTLLPEWAGRQSRGHLSRAARPPVLRVEHPATFSRPAGSKRGGLPILQPFPALPLSPPGLAGSSNPGKSLTPSRTTPAAPVATSAAPGSAPAAPAGPAASAGLFAPTSVWNQPLPANAPLDPSSSSRITALMSSINPPGPGVWLNWNNYSVPVYRVPSTQPTVRVTLDVPVPALQRAWQAVPLPASATPAPGTDASLAVYQPSTGRMWEFWRLARGSGGGFHARWGGAMASVSTSPGYYSPGAWPGGDANGAWSWGSSASSLPAMAGLMTISELRSRRVDHALAVATPQACRWFVWPAQRTDGTSSSSNCLPEGAHLRLDPGLDLDRLRLSPIALTIARAMQKYGLIVHDTTNSSVSLSAEQPTDGSDPYDGSGGIFGGLQEWQFLPQIPWNRLQLLQMGRACTQAPCSASG